MMHWDFLAEDWHAIMEDFRKKVHDSGEYNRIGYPQWRELMAATKIHVLYDESQKTFEIMPYSPYGKFEGYTSFKVDEATLTGKKTFGDYLATYIIHIPEVEEKQQLSINYNTTTAYAATDTATISAVSYGTATIDSNVLTTDYATKVCIKPESIKKENNKMDNKIFNFDFGPVKGDNIRMSMYGLAVKNRDGNYVAWDKTNENIMNVDILNFSGDGLMYKMPVAIKDIKDGDIVIHNKVPMFVLEVFDKSLDVIDIYSGERKSIIPAKSPFNFNFATKVISLIDFGAMGGDAPDADHPFGNMWPLLMLGDSSSIDPMMLALMCAGKGDCANPMMTYALMASKGGNDNLLPLMLMMNGGKFGC